MTVLALSMSSCYLMGEKSQLEYEEMEYVNDYNDVTGELSNYLDKTTEANKKHTSGDDEYKRLQAKQQEYDSKKTTIESRLKVINSQIEGFQEAVKNNIKSECKLSLSV